MLGGRRTVNLIKSKLLFLRGSGLGCGRSRVLGWINRQRVYGDGSCGNGLNDGTLEARGYSGKVVVIGRTDPQSCIGSVRCVMCVYGG